MPPWWVQGKVSSGLPVTAFTHLKETRVSAPWFYPISLSQTTQIANPVLCLNSSFPMSFLVCCGCASPSGSCLWSIHLKKEIHIFLPQPCTSPVFPTALTPYHLFPIWHWYSWLFLWKAPSLLSLLNFVLWISSCFTHLSQKIFNSKPACTASKCDIVQKCDTSLLEKLRKVVNNRKIRTYRVLIKLFLDNVFSKWPRSLLIYYESYLLAWLSESYQKSP